MQENFDEQIDENKKLVIDLLNDDKEYSHEKLQQLLNFINNCENYKNKLNNVEIIVANERIPYNVFEIVEKLYQKSKNLFTVNLAVKHYDNCNRKDSETTKLWDIETIINANKYIDEICSIVKNNNLSPAEALAYIHLRVSKVAHYQSSENRTWSSNDQYLVGAFMKKPEFVCAGFASLEKQIIDELNMPELKCDILNIDLRKKDGSTDFESHARLIINITDKKYDINGHFYSDPTWDNVSKDKTPVYSHMFMPNDCHEYGQSKYEYDEDAYIYKKVGKYERRLEDFPLYFAFCNESPVFLQQEKLEEIVFNTMSKTSNKSFNDLYSLLGEMAKSTYDNQIERQYREKYSPTLQLQRQDAQKIYNAIKNGENSQEKSC